MITKRKATCAVCKKKLKRWIQDDPDYKYHDPWMFCGSIKDRNYVHKNHYYFNTISKSQVFVFDQKIKVIIETERLWLSPDCIENTSVGEIVLAGKALKNYNFDSVEKLQKFCQNFQILK